MQSFLNLLLGLVFTAGILHAAPANDAFSSAQTLRGNGGGVTGSNIAATGETGEPGHWGSTGGTSSIWYQWIPSVSGMAQIDTNGSTFDTVLAVYTGSSLGALSQITSDDDSGSGLSSAVTLSVTAGTSYRIAVAGYGNQVGNTILNYNVNAPLSVPIVSSALTANGTVGKSFSFYTVTASNSPTGFTATSLPPGLAINPSSGLIYGNPTKAGSFTTTISATNAIGSGSRDLAFTISKGTAVVSFSGLSHVYDGGTKLVSVVTQPAGLAFTLAHNGNQDPPFTAGNHSVTCTISDPNYEGTSSAVLIIAKAPATVSLAGLLRTFDGNPKAATAATIPTGLAVGLTYNGTPAPPTAVGAHTVVGTINDLNYQGSATGTMTIQKPVATIALSNLVQIQNGSPRPITATTNPAGLAVTITYNGTAIVPSAEGNYAVVATLNDSNYLPATATGTLIITLYPDPYVFTTLAGSGSYGTRDGAANWAQFIAPADVVVHPNGVIYVADRFAIRKIAPEGTVTTLAGSSSAQGSTDGIGSDARFTELRGIALDDSGNLLATDGTTVRKITTDGVVTTLAGLAGTSGSNDGTGSAARFDSPQGIALDAGGTIYLTEPSRATIRKVTATGIVSTFAGQSGVTGSIDATGNAARFNYPAGIAVNKTTGMIYIADSGNHKIRAISPQGVVSTLVGAAGTTANVDGDAATALFHYPSGLTLDAAGNLFVTNRGAIRKITPEVVVTSIAGAWNTSGYVNGTGGTSRFNQAAGLAIDSAGDLYIADSGNSAVRKGRTSFRAGPPVIFNAGTMTGYVTGISPAFAIAATGVPTLYAATDLPAGLTLNPSTGVISGTPTLAGSYNVLLSATNAEGTGNAILTWVVTKYERVVLLSNLMATYDGTPKSATGTVTYLDYPNLVFTYNGSTIPPTALGSYTVIATLNDPVNMGSATGIFQIVKPIATVTVGNLVQVFDGTPRVVTVTTTPPGLSVSLSYDGSPAAPTDAGAYALVATLEDDTYQPVVINRWLEVSTYPTPYTFTTFAGRTGGVGSENGAREQSRYNLPGSVVIDGVGNLYIADTSNHTIRKITPAGIVSTFAGIVGTSGSADGMGSTASFNGPAGIAMDPAGNIYVADTGNHTIRKITSAGLVTTLAGTAGTSGTASGTGGIARFKNPAGLAFHASILYVVDTGNHAIRKITSSGVVTTFTGNIGIAGDTNATGTAAGFRSPVGIALDSAGNVFVAEEGASRIRKITSAGVVTLLAGKPSYTGYTDDTGTLAVFNKPRGLTIDSVGNLYVADTQNHAIRKVTQAGVVTTFAGAGSGTSLSGSVDGSGPSVRFYNPRAVIIDSSGTMYIADTDNNAIRKITGGVVSTYSGGPLEGSSDGTGLNAQFNYPQGAAVDQAGNIYVADRLNSTLRKITPSGVVTTLAGLAENEGYVNGTGSAARFRGMSGVAVDSIGNVYVAEYERIRKITPDGVVTDYAGFGNLGASNGLAQYASFNYPTGLAFDSADNLYVADTKNHLIRKITAAGIVSTFAGTSGISGSADGQGVGAKFQYPRGLAIDSTDRVYVADAGGGLIRKISPTGLVTTFAGTVGIAGSADGASHQARFRGGSFISDLNVYGMAVDSNGNVFTCDSANHTIRRITANGEVSTLAGKIGVQGLSDGTGTEVEFSFPYGMALDSGGNLYVVGNNAVRKGTIILAVPVITSSSVATGRVGVSFTGYRITASGAATSFAATGLPLGLTCNPATGILSGTPSQFGSFMVGVSATNNTGSGSGILSLTIEKPLASITLSNLAQNFNGTPRPATVLTQPAGLGLSVLYNGSIVTPTAPGSYEVTAVLTDTNYQVSPVTGTLVISTSLTSYTFTTFAGTVDVGSSNDGQGSAARFGGPFGIATDAAGNIYVADTGNSTIRKITPGGMVSTLAGSPGEFGSTDGLGSAARFGSPVGVAVDGAGNVYVADTGNATVRKITPAGLVTTLAGSPGEGGSDDGIGSAARFSEFYGIAVTPGGTVYVADFDNLTIRKITPAGVVTTLAGSPGEGGYIDATGSAARFGGIISLALDRAGNIYAADLTSGTIRKITPEGVVTTFAGMAGQFDDIDGVGSAARFEEPFGVAVDAGGNVYVTDRGVQKVRKITAAGLVTTMAGAWPNPSYQIQDGTGVDARFTNPAGVAVDHTGYVYVVDQSGNTIHRGYLETGAGAPVISSPSAATGTYGIPIASYVIQATSAPFGFSASGLPSGLSLNTQTGEISGTPLAAGSFYASIQATNASGTGTTDLTFTIFKAVALVELEGLEQVYNGQPKPVSARTTPGGLALNLTYEGSAAVPRAAGRYLVEGSVADSNYSGTTSGILIIRSTATAFQAQAFTPAELLDSSVSGLDADPDGDGVSNLLEYAFAMNPKAAGSSGLPALGTQGDNLTLSFIRRKNTADLVYEVEVSDGLTGFVSGKNQTVIESVTSLDEERERVTIRDQESRTSNPSRFLRVQVSVP